MCKSMYIKQYVKSQRHSLQCSDIVGRLAHRKGIRPVKDLRQLFRNDLLFNKDRNMNQRRYRLIQFSLKRGC